MKIIGQIQHHLNALHIYSLLVRMGFDKSTAKIWATRYEQVIHPILYEQYQSSISDINRRLKNSNDPPDRLIAKVL
jgi:hypothetical protein